MKSKEFFILCFCFVRFFWEVDEIFRRFFYRGRSFSSYSLIMWWVVRDRFLIVFSVLRRELKFMCFFFWTLTWKVRVRIVRCFCVGWGVERVGRLYTNWRKNFCFKCFTLFKYFFFFKVNKLKYCVYFWIV